jgi:hypothetical protein
MQTNAFNIRASTDYHFSQSTGPALAIAPDPAVTPGAQGLRLVPIAEGYGHHPDLEDVLLTLTFEQLAEAWAKVQQLKKPEFRQPLLAMAGAEVGLELVA